MRNEITFELTGRYALFTDPLTRVGGEKCSYHIPTYEALKGVVKSIYWKPTIIWHIDKVRVMNPIRTQTSGVKPLNYGGGSSLAIYTYLADVKYQVQAHFEQNKQRENLAQDYIEGKHYSIAKRMLERGGRQDIFLGTRECQGYVEPCAFGQGSGTYDTIPELAYGVMFHGFDYPDETGVNKLVARFWRPVMKAGVIEFLRPEQCDLRKEVRPMYRKEFGQDETLKGVEVESDELRLDEVEA